MSDLVSSYEPAAWTGALGQFRPLPSPRELVEDLVGREVTMSLEPGDGTGEYVTGRLTESADGGLFVDDPKVGPVVVRFGDDPYNVEAHGDGARVMRTDDGMCIIVDLSPAQQRREWQEERQWEDEMRSTSRTYFYEGDDPVACVEALKRAGVEPSISFDGPYFIEETPLAPWADGT